MSVDGSRERYEQAVRASMADLLAYFERRVEVRADAADLLSDTLLAAWRKRRRMPPGNERPWLFTFARNTLLNARRAHRRRTAATENLRSVLMEPPAGTPCDEAVELRSAVTALGVEHRELIELVHWEGLSITESAQIIGINSSTARSRYAMAKKLLHDQLNDSRGFSANSTGTATLKVIH
jgi:RNA polymerase sigma-70 factor (ECF subfamily)